MKFLLKDYPRPLEIRDTSHWSQRGVGLFYFQEPLESFGAMLAAHMKTALAKSRDRG